MAYKGAGLATDWKPIDEFDGGVGWMAYPNEPMQRASHALVDGDDVWVVDPVDAEGLDEFLAEYGTVAGVVLGLDRHKRDAAAIARRHDVAVHLPPPLDGVADDLAASTTPFRGELANSGYESLPLVDRLGWREAALYDEDRGVLLVPEAVGTSKLSCTPGERLGVHPILRLWPPRSLADLAVDHVHVGHRTGVHEDATRALRAAIDRSRRGFPRLAVQNARMLSPI
jgi:hypothetical protein